MQAEIDDIREQISGQGDEETLEKLDRIVGSLDELTDLFRYGEAFVKKVGDYDPPKRPSR